MPADIYYIPQKGGHAEMASKLSASMENIDLPWVKKGAKIGIKLHWGEPGNNMFLPPDYARAVASHLLKFGAKPFIFDTTTLYGGNRREAIDTLFVANEHGFGYDSVGVPVIVGDGFSGTDVVEIPVPGSPLHFENVKVVSLVDRVDGIITLSHFKGHLASGFGGVIKNIAMGMACRATKQKMHADVSPELKDKKCTGCGICADVCPENAIELLNDKPKFDLDKCIGCAECIAMCPETALKILWNASPEAFVEKLAETFAAVCYKLKGKMFHIQVLANIAPECDCMPRKMKPFVPDSGILMGPDPVAVDTAACDLVNDADVLPDSKIKAGEKDKIHALYPKVPYKRQLEYAEELGVGTIDYRLIRLD